MWYAIAAFVAFQILLFLGYAWWLRRRVRNAYDACVGAWKEAAERLSLELLPRERPRDVIHMRGNIEGFHVELWGLLLSGRRLRGWAGLWTHITIALPALHVGVRPRSPTVLWLKHQGTSLDIATPGFAAYTGLMPPESDAIDVKYSHPALLYFGHDEDRANALFKKHEALITQHVLGRSIYIHNNTIQLNHREISDDPNRLTQDIDTLLQLARALTA